MVPKKPEKAEKAKDEEPAEETVAESEATEEGDVEELPGGGTRIHAISRRYSK